MTGGPVEAVLLAYTKDGQVLTNPPPDLTGTLSCPACGQPIVRPLPPAGEMGVWTVRHKACGALWFSVLQAGPFLATVDEHGRILEEPKAEQN